MTDIDALIAYAKRELTSYPQLSRAETNALLDALTAERARIAELEAENTHLRAALATSKGPCVYCQLPAGEMAQCRSGFPGCARMDDIMGCPEFGAMMCLSDAQADATCWREVAGELAVELNRIADVTERWTDSLVSQVNEIARAAITAYRAAMESGE